MNEFKSKCLGYLPAITRSMALSKCFSDTDAALSLAAIKAASLQMFAMSAPVEDNLNC